MEDDETLAQYTVYDGMHYIITEKEVIEPRKPYVNEQLSNLNEYWFSQFELIEIEEPKENKVLLTLDENKELSINSNHVDEVDVIYMLMTGLIRVCKEVELEQDLMIETIKEIWGCVE